MKRSSCHGSSASWPPSRYYTLLEETRLTNTDALLSSASDAEVSDYYDERIYHAEVAAVQWLRQQASMKSTVVTPAPNNEKIQDPWTNRQ